MKEILDKTIIQKNKLSVFDQPARGIISNYGYVFQFNLNLIGFHKEKLIKSKKGKILSKLNYILFENVVLIKKDFKNNFKNNETIFFKDFCSNPDDYLYNIIS